MGGARFRSAAEFLREIAAKPAPQFLVDDWLAPGNVALFHGQPRDGKSLLALEMAIGVATGTAAFGVLPVHHARPVWYVAEEDARVEFALRLRAMLRGRGLAVPEQLIVSSRDGIRLDDEADHGSFLRDAQATRAELIVLDPLRQITNAVDQGPAELRPFARFIKKLVDTTGATVLLVHHDTKQSTARDYRHVSQRVSGGGLLSMCESPVSIQRAHHDSKRAFTTVATPCIQTGDLRAH